MVYVTKAVWFGNFAEELRSFMNRDDMIQYVLSCSDSSNSRLVPDWNEIGRERPMVENAEVWIYEYDMTPADFAKYVSCECHCKIADAFAKLVPVRSYHKSDLELLLRSQTVFQLHLTTGS